MEIPVGAMAVNIGADKARGLVTIEYSEPVKAIAIAADVAKMMAAALMRMAQEADVSRH
jgi:hypothetical protein